MYLLLAVPVINAFASVTTNYFPPGYYTPGAIRVALLMLVIVLLGGYIKKDWTTLFIFLFLFYVALLIPFSSNEVQTFNSTIKVTVSLLMFPLGFYLISDLKKLKFLNYSILTAVTIIILQYVIAQVFQLGESAYTDAQGYELYSGGGFVSVTYVLVFFILLMPVCTPLLKKYKNRYLFYGIMIISILLTFFILRRTSIAALIGGYTLYLFLSSKSFKVLKYGMVTLCVLAVAFPIYGDYFTQRANLREPLENISQEGRIVETYAVFNEIGEAGIKHALIGSEPFNSAEYYKHRWFIGGGRPLHIDYNRILSGTGIIGLALYLLIFGSILYSGLKIRTGLNPYYREMKAVLLVLLAVTMVISISGSITTVGFRADVMLYMGALLGIMKSNERTLS
jgi:hypothetical protein